MGGYIRMGDAESDAVNARLLAEDANRPAPPPPSKSDVEAITVGAQVITIAALATVAGVVYFLFFRKKAS